MKESIKEKQRLAKRESLFKKQRKERGWDDSETWSLDTTIARLVLPRLKRFKEVNCGYPGFLSIEKWDEILDHMIYAMEVCSDEELYYGCKLKKKDWKRVSKGFKLFGKYFQNLWW
jgi:hypothetical protein